MSLRKRITWRPTVRSILLMVNLSVLILPLGSIYFLRFYENELVRQTESELIAQGVIISALVKKEMGHSLQNVQNYRTDPHNDSTKQHGYYQPIPALLDLSSDTILPPRQAPISPMKKADPQALRMGTQLNDLLSQISRTTLAGIRVTDYQGIVVASSKEEMGLDYSHVNTVAETLKGKSHSIIRKRLSDEPYPALASISRGTGIRIFVNMPVIINERVVGAVLLSRSPKNILKALHDRKHEAVAMITLLLVIVIFLTILTSYTINRPIYALIDKAKRITKGEKNIDLKVDKRITKEVAMLSDAIATMANTIEKRSRYIQNFAYAISHEFKTPLTSIGGTVELLQQHLDEMPLEKRKRFLEIIALDTKRLRLLVDRLLEHANADVMEASNAFSSIASCISPLQARYLKRGLSIQYGDAFIDCDVPVATDILARIFINLFDNSLQHGATQVVISSHVTENNTTINVTDNGTGVSAANQDKIFSPFFTTNREHGGTGLGLGIVRALLNTHGGDISLKHTTHGACFSVHFARD